MATLVGKVGMVAKGDWSSGSTYEVMDVVTYSGGTYIAKQAVPAGTLPTNTTYWQVGIGAPAIEADTLELSTLDANFSGKAYIRKQNDVVSIYFYDMKATTFSTLSGAIPEKYRPLVHGYSAALCKLDGSYGGKVDVSTTGNIAFSGVTTNVYTYGTLTYVR